VPLTRFQSEVLKVIAQHRNPDSFVAGASAINRDGPRFSPDIDIFHDRMESVGEAAAADAGTLRSAGYTVAWLRRLPSIISAEVSRGGESTRLEWVSDSDFRFFPVMHDPEFGYVLHPADLAINKLMAAIGRREPRDVIDLLTIHDRRLPLGAIAWAAVEVAPGFTPEGLLAELKRNARYTAAEYRQLSAESPIDAADVCRRLRAAIESAERFVGAMPSDKAGRLFLENGVPVQPDPAKLSEYLEHMPQRRGHWPTSSDVASAMLETHQVSNEAAEDEGGEHD
jgi:hypothetical protein